MTESLESPNASIDGANLKPSIVACVPALNCERTIAKVITIAKKYVDEVVVCDDGSVDMTGEIARGLGATVLTHSRNQGKGEALRTLFGYARASKHDILVTLDADMQHDPNEIPRIVDELIAGDYDVVVGERFTKDKRKMPKHRLVGNRILNGMSAVGVSDSQSGFRGYSRAAFLQLRPTEMGMGIDSELLMEASRLGMRIGEVQVSVDYDLENTSVHNPLYHALDVLLATLKQLSIRHPLLFYGLPGFISLLIGAGFWWLTLASFAQTKVLETNYALIAAASSIAGLVLASVGVQLWVIISVVRGK